MKSFSKNIFKRLITFFIIIILSTLFLLLGSCWLDTSVINEEIDEAGVLDPYSFARSTLELIDINGGDLYPGEIVHANMKIINSGSVPSSSIEIKLIADDLLIIDTGDNSLVMEALEPGRSRVLTIPMKVIENISKDTNVFAKLIINEGEDSEFSTDEKNLLIFGVYPYERRNIPIIGLHAVEDEIEIPIELYTHHFNELCKALKTFGFETITFKDLLDHIDHGRVLPEKSVIITSDDGSGDLYINALHILKEYDYKMTVFLVTGFIKETEEDRVVNYFDEDRPVPMRPMLIWPEVSEMYDYGCEFLSHSVDHIHLGSADDEEFLYQLKKSKEDIESHLGNEVVLFAWPYDNSSQDKIPLLPEAGYRGAVRYSGGMEDITTLDINNIKRIEFNSYIPPYDYAGYLDLLDLEIKGHLNNLQQTAGEPFILEYVLKNNDKQDVEITSFELEIDKNLELDNIDPSGYISEYPGKVEDTFIWVSDNYKISAGDKINLLLILSGTNPGRALVRFRLTSYDTYFKAEDIEINIQ